MAGCSMCPVDLVEQGHYKTVPSPTQRIKASLQGSAPCKQVGSPRMLFVPRLHLCVAQTCPDHAFGFIKFGQV